MGYRSNGAIYLSNEAQELLPPELADDLKNEWDVGSVDGVWEFEYWKWYPVSYPEVKLWEEFMAKLAKLDVKWDFIRIGEDDCDIDIRTSQMFSSGASIYY